jgi:hypothetical protein
MTSTVTDATRDFILSHSHNALTTSVGVVAIALLIVLLAQQELVRALDGTRLREQMRALNAFVGPLLLASGIVIVTRAAELL